MKESWRDILQKAAANLSIEATGRTPSHFEGRLKDRHGSPWSAVQPHLGVEDPDLLARELEAISARASKHRSNRQQRQVRHPAPAAAVKRPHVAFVVTPPPQNVSVARVEPRKSRAWRNLAAISVSGAIIGLTGHEFLNHGAGTARVGTGQSMPSDVVEGNRASLKRAPQVSTALTERQPEAEPAFSKGSEPPASQALRNPLFLPEQNHGSGPGTASKSDANDVALAPKPMMSSLNRATEDALLERASSLFQHGDIAMARVIYETLASHGNLRGTFKLAETYEARHPAMGLKPDIRLARQWYEKAALLGSIEAYQRLKALESGTVVQSEPVPVTRKAYLPPILLRRP
jgi:hypothetical protein